MKKFLIGLALAAGAVIIGGFFTSYWRISVIVTLAIVAIAVAHRFIIYWLAKRNLFWTMVNQKTNKVVVHYGKFHKVLGPGLQWIGCWPFYWIYTYLFKWDGIDKEGKVQEHPGEPLDNVLVVDDVYACRVEKAEDKQKLPLKWLLALTMKVTDPEKALFAVQNWFETAINRISPYVRDFSTLYTYEEFIEKDMKLEAKILTALEGGPRPDGTVGVNIIKLLLDKYGVEVSGLEVRDIDPGEEYRERTLKKWTAQQDLLAAQILAQKSAQDTMGLLIQMYKLVEEEAAPSVRDELRKQTVELVHRKMGIDGKALMEIKGASALEGAAVAWLTGLTGPAEPAGPVSSTNSVSGFAGGAPTTGSSATSSGGVPATPATAPKSVEDAAKEFFDKYQKYPTWDPLKRKPSL